MRKIWILIIVISLLGCSNSNNLEELGMMDTVAFDRATENNGASGNSKLRIALTIPKPGQIEKSESTVLETTAESPKDARSKLIRKTDKVLVAGQLRNLLFSADLSKQGIWKLLESYRRDYSVGERTLIAIVNGSAVDLISHKYPNQPSIGVFLHKMLDQESDIHDIPDVSLYSFAREYYDDGIDPIAPLIKLNKDHVEIDGIALFDMDKYVGKIDAEQTLMFLMLLQSFEKGELHIKFMESSSGSKQTAMLSSIQSKRKVKVVNKGTDANPEVVIHIDLLCAVLEYTGQARFESAKEIDSLSKDLSASLTEQLQKIIGKLQRIGTDNLGIGTFVRNSMKYEDWKGLDWKKIYPESSIRVEVQTTIQDTGMIR